MCLFPALTDPAMTPDMDATASDKTRPDSDPICVRLIKTLMFSFALGAICHLGAFPHAPVSV
jgi:hypothetical protein